jgi:peroxiredoxin
MALPVGSPAPQFMLPAMDGSEFDLRDTLAHGPVILAFFKISCPTCQFTFPFLERIHRAYGSRRVKVIGVSQDKARDAEKFAKDYGITFPVLLDDPGDYVVSNAFGLTHVPSIFWIAQNGRIDVESVGWEKQTIERINELAAEFNQQPLVPLLRPDETEVPEFRAG